MSNSSSSNYLYDLIERMNTSEKRYFKIFSKQHIIGKHNYYQKLFDLIIHHQKQGWKGEKFIKQEFVNSFGKIRYDLYKSNLYKKLLLSLESYHKERNIVISLRSKINQSTILLHRGLPFQALSILKKVKGVCNKHEKWYILLEVLELERDIKYAIQNPSLENNEEERILEKSIAVFNHRKIQSKLWKTYVKNGLPTDKESTKVYSSLLDELSSIQPIEKNNTIEIELIQLYCKQFISGMEGNIPATYKYGITLVDLMEENSNHIANRPELYIRALINLQYAQIRLNREREVTSNREKCKNILGTFKVAPSFKFAINTSLFVNQYDIAFKNKKFAQLNKIIKEFKAYFEKNREFEIPSIFLLYNWQMATHHFVHEDYNSALDYNYKIINSKLSYRSDIQSLARLMNLIMYFELGQVQLLKSFTLSAYRYLKKKQRLLPIENFLIKFIRKELSNSSILSNKKKSFPYYFNQLKKLKGSEDSHEALLLMYFEFWLIKKIGGNHIESLPLKII